jgi:DNA-binding HxlR family transcriptional regulator
MKSINNLSNINLKTMSTYQEIRRQIQTLTPDEQLRLLEELAAIVRHRIQPKPKRSILELEGLGKEIWQGIDVQEYINQERDSWDG